MDRVTPSADELPRIISVDDHILEPRTLWREALPAGARERGPRVVREKVSLRFTGGHYGFTRNDDEGRWCDLWLYEDLVLPTGLLHAPAGVPREMQANVAAVYEDFRQGTWDQKERLADMDLNHVQAAINYPNTFPRFAGQGFAERPDKDLALACVRIYNDWMIEEWCGGDGRGRLVPLSLVPLWDPRLAAEETRRCADKGIASIAFTENPAKLGLSSLYTGDWDTLWAVCEETGTTVSMHIGSSSSMPTTGPDAPLATTMSLSSQNAQGALCDWVFSGTLERFPRLKIAFAESQVGWLPYLLERMDIVWKEGVGGVELAESPSDIVRGRVWGCVFDDQHGLRSRDVIGLDAILFETDYPHTDGTWPESRSVARRLCEGAAMDESECRAFLRGNAVRCYGLERFGLDA